MAKKKQYYERFEKVNFNEIKFALQDLEKGLISREKFWSILAIALFKRKNALIETERKKGEKSGVARGNYKLRNR